MDFFLSFLGQLTGDELVAQRIFVALSAAAIGVFVLAIGFLLAGVASPVRRRLRHIGGDVDAPGRLSDMDIGRALGPLGDILLPEEGKERSLNEDRLIHAGFRGPNALTTFYALKILGGLGLPVLVLVSVAFMPAMPAQKIATATVIAALIGMLAPSYFLDKRVNSRQTRLRRSFPDALDLLVVCVESGLGLGAAIQRVSSELSISHPLLAAEMAVVNAEMRAGVERIEALKNLADRTGLDDIKGLVTLLAQSMRFGTSIAETLRVYAEEFRDKRMQAAEESAAKIGTKLIFPLTFCLFPAFFLIAIGPAVLKIMEALGKL